MAGSCSKTKTATQGLNTLINPDRKTLILQQINKNKIAGETKEKQNPEIQKKKSTQIRDLHEPDGRENPGATNQTEPDLTP